MASPGPVGRPVLVLDFGSQYVQLIARRVRERHAFATIVRHEIGAGACASSTRSPSSSGRAVQRL